MILLQRLCNFILFCAIFQWISLSRIEASTVAPSEPVTTTPAPSTSRTKLTTTTTTVTSTEHQTTTSEATTATPSSSGCGAGCIAGCVIGGLVLIALIVFAVIFTMRYTKQHPDCCRRKEDKHSDPRPLPDPNRLSDIRHTDHAVSFRAGGQSAPGNQYQDNVFKDQTNSQKNSEQISSIQHEQPLYVNREDPEFPETDPDEAYENREELRYQLHLRNQIQQDREYYNDREVRNMQNSTAQPSNVTINLTPGNLSTSVENTEPSYINVRNELQYLPMNGKKTTAANYKNNKNRKFVNVDETMHGR